MNIQLPSEHKSVKYVRTGESVFVSIVQSYTCHTSGIGNNRQSPFWTFLTTIRYSYNWKCYLFKGLWIIWVFLFVFFLFALQYQTQTMLVYTRSVKLVDKLNIYMHRLIFQAKRVFMTRRLHFQIEKFMLIRGRQFLRLILHFIYCFISKHTKALLVGPQS